jgi:hypothetical protein
MNKLKSLILSSALCLASLIGCVPQQELHGGLKTTYAPSVARAGNIVNPKPTPQSLIWAKSGNVSGYVWRREEPREIDFGLRYHHQFSEGVSGRIGFDVWNYPGKNNPLGRDGRDIALEAGIHYSAPLGIELDTTLTHVLRDSDNKSGQMLHTTLSRPVSLGKVCGLDATLTPSINGAYLRDYYGTSGLSQITPGLSLQLKRGNFSLELFGKKQVGNERTGTKDFTYLGIGFSWEF